MLLLSEQGRMSKYWEISIRDGVSWIKILDGDIPLKETIAVIDELYEQRAYHRRIFDMRDHGFQVSFEDVQAISVYSKEKFRDANRGAFLVADDSTYGRIRQLMVFRDQEGLAETMVFRDEREALDWLARTE